MAGNKICVGKRKLRSAAYGLLALVLLLAYLAFTGYANRNRNASSASAKTVSQAYLTPEPTCTIRMVEGHDGKSLLFYNTNTCPPGSIEIKYRWNDPSLPENGAIYGNGLAVITLPGGATHIEYKPGPQYDTMTPFVSEPAIGPYWYQIPVSMRVPKTIYVSENKRIAGYPESTLTMANNSIYDATYSAVLDDGTVEEGTVWSENGYFYNNSSNWRKITFAGGFVIKPEYDEPLKYWTINGSTLFRVSKVYLPFIKR